MARKRMISPTIWEDPSFNSLSHQARLAFIGMISNADDEGSIRADYKSLRRTIFGFDDNELSAWYEEMKNFKNLHIYEVNGEIYAHFINWHEYQIQQKERIQKSTYPKCSICLAGGKQTLTQVSRLSNKVSSEPESLKKLREQFGKKHSI